MESRIPSIYLVVALPAEAKPLIAHYGLKAHTPAGPFPVFRREAMVLVISGVGKINAAAGCAYLHALSGGRADAAWLNVGVAGHAQLPLGEIVLAHRIRDAGSARNWYPPQVLEPPCPTQAVLSVDRPEATYPGTWVYDMEAAGFYATACRFASGERVQCCKIISDNRAHATQQVTAKGVAQLIRARLDVVDTLVSQLDALTAEMAALEAAPAELERFLARWHFSVYEQRRLVGLLRRWRARTGGQGAWCVELERLRGGKDVLRFLEQRLDALPVRWV